MLTNIKDLIKDENSAETLKRPTFLNKSARKWVQAPIYLSRPDKNLKLTHWTPLNRINEIVYPFSKLDIHADIIAFDKEKYNSLDLCAQDWTYEETQLLMQMCKQYELKFFVIQDRYNKAVIENGKYKIRSIEELKKRFYSIDRTLRRNFKMQPEDQLPPAYDSPHEIQRKIRLKQYYSRTTDEIAEETFLINELKRIQSKQKEMDKIRVDTSELLSLADEFIKNKSLDQTKLNSKHNKSASSHNRLSKSSGNLDDQQYADNFNPRSTNPNTSRKRISSGSSVRKKKIKATPSNQPPSKINPVGQSQPAQNSSGSLNANNPPKSGGIGSRTRIIEPFKNAGVHVRSQKMIVTHNIGMKRIKMLEQVCVDLGLDTYPPPTEEIYGMLVELRSQILTLFDLKHVLGVSLYDIHMLRNKHLPADNNEPQEVPIVSGILSPSHSVVSASDKNSFVLQENEKSFSNVLDSMVTSAANCQRKRKST